MGVTAGIFLTSILLRDPLSIYSVYKISLSIYRQRKHLNRRKEATIKGINIIGQLPGKLTLLFSNFNTCCPSVGVIIKEVNVEEMLAA
jgi:hypothetical protein